MKKFLFNRVALGAALVGGFFMLAALPSYAQQGGGVVAFPPITPGDCAKWKALNILEDAGTCPPSGGGFPITIGSTSIAAGSTTTEIDGLNLGEVTPGVGNFTTGTFGGGSIGSNVLEVTGPSTLNGATSVAGASFGLTGNQSASGIFGTSGIRYKNVAGTLNDTTASGTVATNYDSIWGGNTLTATGTVTITNDYGSYFKAPICSTGVTCTNNYALGADSLGLAASANTTPLTIAGYSLTGSNTQPALSITGTWNTSGNASGIFENVTNTACGTCYLINLELGGTSYFFIDKNGNANISNTTSDVNGYSISNYGASAGYNWRYGNTILTSPANAQFQFGTADAATPVAQTLSVQSVSSGTSNTAGVNTTLDLSRGTGSGVGGNLTINGAPHGAAATTQNTYVAMLGINGDTGALTLGTTLYSSCTALTTNSSAVIGCTASDQRLKNDLGIVVPAHDGSPALHKFTFKTFQKWEPKSGKTPGHWVTDSYGPAGIHYGWFAQDIEKVHPELVHIGPKTPLTPKGELQFDKNEYLPLLVAEQQAEIAMLKREVAALEGRR